MKVLIYTHDNPWTGGTGVAAYCRDLTPALEHRGHDVIHTFTEMRDWGGRNRIRTGSWNGTPYAAVVNSSLHPAFSIEHPQQDVSHKGIEPVLLRLLEMIKPDVIHFQTFVGLPASVLLVCRDLGIPTIVTFHDFWVLCPRVLLIRPNGTACSGPAEGFNCVRYCAHPLPWRRRIFRWLDEMLPSGRPRALLSGVRHRYVAGDPVGRAPWAAPPAPVDIDPKAAVRAMAFAGRDHLLLKIAAEADALLAVSQFVAGVLTGHGLPPDRLSVLPLGLSVHRWVRRQARSASRPIRFGFLGRATPLKGVHIFAQAASTFTPDEARFLIFGPAGEEVRQSLSALATSDVSLEFRGPYRREDLQAVLNEVDVAVVPSLAQETVGLVALEAQAAGCPVIAARSGALPEWVKDGENGLLVDPGSPTALADAMRRIVENPHLVASLSRHTVVPPSVEEHADRLAAIYGTIAKRRR